MRPSEKFEAKAAGISHSRHDEMRTGQSRKK